MFENDSHNKPISIIITTLCAMCYSGEPDLYDALINILNTMGSNIKLNNGEYIILNPVDPRENFADKWKTDQVKAKYFYEWLEKAKNDFSNFLQSDDVNILFESAQPILGEKLIKKSFNSYRDEFKKDVGNIPVNHVSKRFDVSHRQELNYPIRIYDGIVSVICKSVYDGYRTKSLINGGYPIKKKVDLYFKASTNIARPFLVLWQVVNTGAEAKRVNQLRGDFYEGEYSSYGLERKESTQYKGIHFVECFIIKNGYCVARSGEFIVNIM
jgi:hypothetical protein